MESETRKTQQWRERGNRDGTKQSKDIKKDMMMWKLGQGAKSAATVQPVKETGKKREREKKKDVSGRKEDLAAVVFSLMSMNISCG